MTSARTSASAAAVLAVGLLVPLASAAEPPAVVGHAAPAFVRAAVRGGTFSLQRQRGHTVLLSFLNTSAASGTDPSRAQVVFLRSMATQHRGLRVVIVDAAAEATGRPARKSDLVNYTYDWALSRAVPVLPDDGSLARRYGVHKVPTTFLIGAGGVLERRWNGFVPAARLDFAIRGRN